MLGSSGTSGLPTPHTPAYAFMLGSPIADCLIPFYCVAQSRSCRSPRGMAQCVLKDVIAHPSVTQGGGLTLECDDGELSVMRNVFAVSSLLIADLVSDGCSLVKVSGSTKEEWLLVISQLYPIVPRPELSLQQLQQVLPVVHKVVP
ncbi:hypothetical protein QJQ45_014593 [Haematococcus lacustris]|nr:hypothetical protein QJQ45_014593 [Haematococcus lacustris]